MIISTLEIWIEFGELFAEWMKPSAWKLPSYLILSEVHILLKEIKLLQIYQMPE